MSVNHENLSLFNNQTVWMEIVSLVSESYELCSESLIMLFARSSSRLESPFRNLTADLAASLLGTNLFVAILLFEGTMHLQKGE